MGKLDDSLFKAGKTSDDLHSVKTQKTKRCRHGHHHHHNKDSQQQQPVIKNEVADEVDPVEGSESSRLALIKLMEHFLHMLQKKDVDGAFANPVSAAACPGYYQMIKEPMDLSTMRVKLKAKKYVTFELFKADFERICNNAMTYNTVDSSDYKFADEMLMYGQIIMSSDRIKTMAKQSPYILQISTAELGFDVRAGFFKAGDDVEVEDSTSTDDLLEEAKAAARGSAAENLRVYKADRQSKRVGFLRQSDDGSTSLGFIIGGSGLIAGTDRRPVSLGSLIGRVKQGTGSLQNYREDRRNLAKSVYPLYYGAYSSYGPCYDSTFATLTKEETDLICSTYYKESNSSSPTVEAILKESHLLTDYSTFIGHHLLDALTNDEHATTSKYAEDEEKLRDEEAKIFSRETKTANQIDESDDSVDFESLKSLADDGIDISFLETLQKAYTSSSQELDQTASLIGELQQVQMDRLSAPPPTHFSMMMPPGDHELDLANQIQSNLLSMTKQVKPDDVVPSDSLRKALGMSVKTEPVA